MAHGVVIVIVMGVAGSGKTSVGREVAARLGWRFIDADDFHTPSDVAKMRDGHALTDTDRTPWLETLNNLLRTNERQGNPVVLACSALKRTYRRVLVGGVTNHQIVYLDVPQPVIVDRVIKRRGHFLAAELVTSQFADLEVPTSNDAIIIDADRPKAAVVDAVIDALQPWVGQAEHRE